MESLFEMLKPLIEMYGGQFGPVAQFIAFLGTARLFLKPFQPLEKAIKEVIAGTPSKKDDELLEQAEQSKLYKSIKFFIDWMLSIKLK